MAITVEDYLQAVRDSVPEARPLIDRLESDSESHSVWQLNDDLTHLLLWSWRTGDRATCARILGVLELGLLETGEDDDAPVWNSVGIGVVETIERDLRPDDLAAFIDTWPPALRERGLLLLGTDDDECCDDGPDGFQMSLGRRLRWALRHPVSSRLGTRIMFAG